jgi:hypothetical protein
MCASMSFWYGFWSNLFLCFLHNFIKYQKQFSVKIEDLANVTI